MQKTITPISHPVDAVVAVPGSKSISNRALLLAALSAGKHCLSGLLASDDTEAMAAALQALGVQVNWDRASAQATVQGCGGQFPNQNATIDCRESGIVMRFLLAVCAAQPQGSFRFTGAARLCQRPVAPLLKALELQGAEFEFQNEPYHLPFTLKAQGLQGGAVVVDITQSSQFLSGLLIAAPLAATTLHVDMGTLANKPYVMMTQSMMQTFKHLPQDHCYAIEPDASTASYFFAAAALTAGKVTVPNLLRKGLQGDTRFLNLLEKMGCKITESNDGITVVGPQKLKGLGEVSMSGFSDTFMTAAALAVYADAPTTLTGLAHTRLQESDRVAAMAEGLQRLGIATETTEDSITIIPGKPVGAIVDSHNDHRIAMSLALIGLKTPGVTIDGAQCVKKTCPAYFEMLERLD